MLLQKHGFLFHPRLRGVEGGALAARFAELALHPRTVLARAYHFLEVRLNGGVFINKLLVFRVEPLHELAP